MSWGFGWRPYVPVAQRRANAARAMAKMTKTGKSVSPVVLQNKKIATTFWGKAWCDNLEAYSDYANRLPRGRTYVRNGSVMDLQISEGKVTAIVSGSQLYKIEIKIKSLGGSLWKAIQSECAGKIDSLMELLQGRLSAGVMQIVTRQQRGLFPSPKEITMECSCPDWAGMCKHIAASLYGVGARLDEKPELLFRLRGLDPEALISKASARDAVRQAKPAAGAAAIGEAELADVFGIELESSSAKPAGPAKVQGRPASSARKPPARKQAKPNPLTLEAARRSKATSKPVMPFKSRRQPPRQYL